MNTILRKVSINACSKSGNELTENRLNIVLPRTAAQLSHKTGLATALNLNVVNKMPKILAASVLLALGGMAWAGNSTTADNYCWTGCSSGHNDNGNGQGNNGNGQGNNGNGHGGNDGNGQGNNGNGHGGNNGNGQGNNGNGHGGNNGNGQGNNGNGQGNNGNGHGGNNGNGQGNNGNGHSGNNGNGQGNNGNGHSGNNGNGQGNNGNGHGGNNGNGQGNNGNGHGGNGGGHGGNGGGHGGSGGDGHSGNGGGHSGPIGPEGPQGPIGPQGLSAYEVAVNNGFDGNEAAWLLSLQGAAGPGGRAVEDAVAESKLYTDSRVDELNRRFDGFKDGVHAAVASSIAIASLPQPTDAGYSMLSVGMGTWEGEQGYAVGFSGVTENNKYVYKLAATTNTEGDFGAGASIGWQWK